MTDERDALEEMVNVAVAYSHDADHIMNAVDELVASERLDEHVKTCREFTFKKCGEHGYCDRAPIKERS